MSLRLSLRILTGDLAGQKFELKEGDNFVGRAPDCDIVINVNGLSKKHACIHVSGNVVTISDLRSSNGTYVNGIRIIKKEITSFSDKIGFHNILADIKTTTKSSTRHSRQEIPQFQVPTFNPPIIQGSSAIDSGPQMLSATSTQQEDLPQNIFERFQKYIDEVAMPGVYRLAEIFEFRFVIGSFILAFILLMTVFSVLPMMKITKDSVESESRRRALTIARNLAAINQSYLQQNVETAVSTKSAEREEGVQIALVVSNRDGHVIAPTANLGEYPDQPFVHRARKESREMVEQLNDDLIGAAVPINVYSPESGQQTVAHAIVLYSMGSLAMDSVRYISLFSQILLISLVLGFVLYFFLVKLMEQPLVLMGIQIEEAMKDDTKNVSLQFQLPVAKQLIVGINSLLQRSGPSGMNGQNFQSIDYTTEAANLLGVMANPAAALDKDCLFLNVNTVFEDLVGMRLLTLQGQSLEILQDQALKMSIQDLFAKAQMSPSSIVNNQLDFAGIPYEISLQGIASSSGIAYYLLSMRKQEGMS